jgi:hypothetical protein
MNKRVNAATLVLVCAVLAALAVGLVACGSEAATTTTAPSTTATTAPPTTAAPTTTSPEAPPSSTESTAGTGSVTVSSLEMTPELQAYLQQLETWAATLETPGAENESLDITDISQVTDAQVQAAEAVQKQTHAALDGLKAIEPPAQLKSLHDNLVGILASGVEAVDKAVEALKKKDQAMFDTAKAQMDQIGSQMEGLFESMASLLMGGTPTS